MKDAGSNQKDTFVLDTSFVLAYLLPDEKERSVDKMFSKFEDNTATFIAPPLLTYETTNGLKTVVLQKRQDPKAAELLLDAFLKLGILFENVNEKEVFRLAIKEKISAYDACYVWLAKSRKVKLLTLDKRLEKL